MNAVEIDITNGIGAKNHKTRIHIENRIRITNQNLNLVESGATAPA